MSLRRTFLAILFAVSTLSASAQVDTGSIVGTVFDNQRQRLANSTVAVRNESTGVERSLKSGHDGDFSFSPLAIGTYTLSVQHEGV